LSDSSSVFVLFFGTVHAHHLRAAFSMWVQPASFQVTEDECVALMVCHTILCRVAVLDYRKKHLWPTF